MKIEQWEIDQIKPYEKNPRRNEKAVEAVAKSIHEFGFRQPIVVDAGGVIVVGHTRWKAALKLDLKTVPVHVAADLTPQQARAYRLADNRAAEIAEWDVEFLPIELGELRGDGVDLKLSGFTDKELAEYLKNFDTDLKENGIAERTLRRVKKEAEIDVYREGSGPGAQWFWRLPGWHTWPQQAIDGQQMDVAANGETDHLCEVRQLT